MGYDYFKAKTFREIEDFFAVNTIVAMPELAILVVTPGKKLGITFSHWFIIGLGRCELVLTSTKWMIVVSS